MHSNLLRVGALGALGCFLIGCASTGTSIGIHVIRVPPHARTVARYGVVHDVPRAPKLQCFSAEGTNRFYEAPFEILYTWARPNSVKNGEFDLFLPSNRIADGTHPLTRESVETFLRAKRDPAPHVFELVEAKPDNRFGEGCFHFVVRKRRTNPGNLGFIQIEEGYVFVHPYDSERLVVVMFGDLFDPAQEMAPDGLLRDFAEEWFRSIRIEAPSEEEKAYMRRRDWKWVPLDGKIPR